MAKIFEEWTVLDHSHLKKLTDNLWTVTGKVPGVSIRRRMTLLRLVDKKIVIHSPIALKDEDMDTIEQWGQIAYIIIPNGWHRLDSKIYKQRFPDAKIVCPRGSRKKIESVLPVDLTFDEFPKLKELSLTHINGLKGVEGVVEFLTEKGTVLIFNDLVFNIPHQSGLGGFILKLMGSSGGPKVTRLMTLFVVKDKRRVSNFLLKLTEKHQNIEYIIPGHGYVINQECNQVLKNIANAL